MTETSTPEKVEDVAHSKLGASGAWRWMNCPGSVNITEKMLGELHPGDVAAFERGGPAASEGTAAHHVAAKALENEREAWEYIGERLTVDGREFEVDQEMADGVQVHLDLVNSLMEKHAEDGARLYVEHSMSSMLDEEAFGTADAIVYVPGVKIIVVDFKYGRGVVVEPDSVQNRYYGYLAIEEFDSRGIEEIELWITQPRIPHPKGLARRHVTTVEEIETWFTREVLPAMKETRDPEAGLQVGEWCRFCPARDVCPALQKEVMDFDMSLDPQYMTGEELGRLLQRGEALKKYLAQLEQEAFRRAKNGEEVSGYKLVHKKANRIWKEDAEEKLREQFGDDAFQPAKLKTPPMVEKLPGGKKFVTVHAYKPDTGLTLAPESDKREGVQLDGEEFFGAADDWNES